MRTRHWAVIGLAAMGVVAIWKGEIEVASAIATAIGATFLWDKIAKSVSKK
jgi:hypothetical protein